MARQFLSTPSARRATLRQHKILAAAEISIHALREEGDGGRCGCIRLILTFLSTPSARRATGVRLAGRSGHSISIHALREEGDAGS